MSANRKGLFIGDDGKSLMFTFILVSSLFLLWGFCNGMIDVMDKHFQTELGLSKSQSAWVQFAHYLGYFLRSFSLASDPTGARSVTCTVPKRLGAVSVTVRAARSSPRENARITTSPRCTLAVGI